MESTIDLFTTELIDHDGRVWSGRMEIERETAEWVHWFNTARLHSPLEHLPAGEFEARYRRHQPTPQAG